MDVTFYAGELLTIYSLKLKSQTWKGSFPEVFKNGQKIENFTFLRAITFCVKQLGRSRLCRGESHNLFYSLNPKSQICKGSF